MLEDSIRYYYLYHPDTYYRWYPHSGIIWDRESFAVVWSYYCFISVLTNDRTTNSVSPDGENRSYKDTTYSCDIRDATFLLLLYKYHTDRLIKTPLTTFNRCIGPRTTTKEKKCVRQDSNLRAFAMQPKCISLTARTRTHNDVRSQYVHRQNVNL